MKFYINSFEFTTVFIYIDNLIFDLVWANGEIYLGLLEAAKTILVLLGRRGNGKSATGNSIIGANVFDTMPSSLAGTTTTTTCQLQRTIVDDGHILNVIDTPGTLNI